MLRLALIGKNIAHSKSEEVYKNLVNTPFEYELLDYESELLIPTLNSLFEKFQGISITAPYKSSFTKQIKDLSEHGIVNCLRLNNGVVEATNTDFLAVKEILERYLNCGVSKIRILGDGSMSQICQKILHSKNISFEIFSRRKNNLDLVSKNLDKPDFSCLIINTCSRDFRLSHSSTWGYHFWDMNYDMSSHRELFSRVNVSYFDGLEQLELQAKYALSFWNLDCT